MLNRIVNRIAAFTILFSVFTLSIVIYTETNNTYFKFSFEKLERPTPKIYSVDEMETMNQSFATNNDTQNYNSIKETVKTVSDKDVECLARNIYFESRNQSLIGQLMVALVSIERKNNMTHFPSSICKVVYAPKQFSWTNNGDKKPNLNNKLEKEAWERAQIIARFSLIIDTNKPLFNITHYHTLDVKPYWSKSKTLKAAYVIDDHIFYKEQRG